MIKLKRQKTCKEVAKQVKDNFENSKLKDVEAIIYGYKTYPITLLNDRKADAYDIEQYIKNILSNDEFVFDYYVEGLCFNICDFPFINGGE